MPADAVCGGARRLWTKAAAADRRRMDGATPRRGAGRLGVAPPVRDHGWTWSDPGETPVHDPNRGWTALCGSCLGLQQRAPWTRRPGPGDATWPGRGVLAQGAGGYSYPAVVAAASGGLHVLHTHERRSIRHLRVRQDWLA